MPLITPELLTRFDVPGPRYTSYPTADRFGDAFHEADLLAALAERRAERAAQPLSLYVHIPFCEALCYYCACNKIITRHHEKAQPYLELLAREAELCVQHLGAGQQVSQLHFGGGSPTFMNDAELRSLMEMLRRHFSFAPEGEYSIEIDPRTVDEGRLKALSGMGFNRISFGVQDFDPEVQKAVHRVQPAESVFALMAAARRLGFTSINVDLIYGLPKQTPQSFARTLAQMRELRPERIALYAYAHLPERFKPQRRINAAELPGAAEKVGMLAAALQSFEDAGYDYIGMDHFALPDDPLAIAKRQGKLHRNFQGYSTQPDCDMVGLGVSAISKVGAVYSQNAKTLEEYQAPLEAGHLPVVRGLTASADDLLRRAVIMAIMCQGRVRFADIEAAHGISFASHFATELERLRAMQGDGLVEVHPDRIQVTPMGWFFVRGVAMVFDTYVQSARARFSKIL